MELNLKIKVESLDNDNVRYAMELSGHYDIEVSDNPEFPYDMVLVLGGDGSIIYNKKSKRPIIPVRLVDKNKGISASQGFITNQSILELDKVYKKLEAKEYRIEEYLTLDIYLNDYKKSNAINDIYLNLKEPRKAMRFDVLENGDRLFNYRLIGDGVIVATPLGSTGYNASAGGYILEPTEDKIIVTLNNPVGISEKEKRSRIVDSDSEIEIKVYRPDELWLCVDGDELFSIKSSDKIKIKKSNEMFKIVKLDGMEESQRDKIKRRERWTLKRI